ncbi:MAG: hypothetical protein IJH64_04440 [Oscillospiraceae bacterium]|nr:hypothetical protein [Oscillospiraceae bacterium]
MSRVSEGNTFEYDWRRPLYQAALVHQKTGGIRNLLRASHEFALLGHFSDSAAHLTDCRAELDRILSGLLEEVDQSDDLLMLSKCIEELKEAGDFGQAREIMQKALVKRDGLARTKKRKRKILRFLPVAAACLLAVLLLLLPLYIHFKEKELLARAGRLEKEADYEAALDLYWKLTLGELTISDQAKKAIPACQKMLASQKTDEKEFELAVSLYKETGDRAGVRKAYIAWSRDLLEKGDYAKALEIIEKVTDAREKEELLAKAHEIRHDQKIRESEKVMDTAGSETGRIRELRKLAKNIDDIDSLLKYCTWLEERGIDPGDIFPDGAIVTDVSLTAYKPWKDPSEEANQKNTLTVPDKSKFLVFSRRLSAAHDGRYLRDKGFLPDSNSNELPWDDEDDRNFEIRLVPASLYELSKEKRAASMDECSHILLADAACGVGGHVELELEFTMHTSRITHTRLPKTYPLVFIYDNVTVYDKKRPGYFAILGAQKNDPPYDPLKSPQPDLIKNVKTYDFEPFWGRSDAGYLSRTLEEGVKKINEN